jgi:hypothetical protein
MARKVAGEPVAVETIIADAFGGEADLEDEEAVEDAVGRLTTTAYIDDALLPDETPPSFEPLVMGATLQDGKFATASNGANYDLTFEIGVKGFADCAFAMDGKRGYVIEFDKYLIGEGGEIRRGAMTRDADGAAHYKISIHLAQSEIARSLGRMGDLIGKHAMLVMEPMQGTLNLPDGTEIDLTKRADED